MLIVPPVGPPVLAQLQVKLLLLSLTTPAHGRQDDQAAECLHPQTVCSQLPSWLELVLGQWQAGEGRVSSEQSCCWEGGKGADYEQD